MKNIIKTTVRSVVNRLGYDFELHRIAKKGEIVERPVAFIHVPKCGGMSIERGLRDVLGEAGQPRISRNGALAMSMATFSGDTDVLDGVAAFSDHHSRLLSGLLAFHLDKKWSYVSGHVTTNRTILDLYAEQYDFVTVLRDPVKRFVSNYIFNKLTNTLPVMAPDSLNNLDENALINEAEAILAHRRGWQMANVLSMCICGRYPKDEAEAKQMQQEFADNIARYKVVGFLDNLDGFAENMEGVIGKRPEFGFHNTTDTFLTPERQRIKSILSDYFKRPDVHSRVEELCRFDMENYQQALSSFRP